MHRIIPQVVEVEKVSQIPLQAHLSSRFLLSWFTIKDSYHIIILFYYYSRYASWVSFTYDPKIQPTWLPTSTSGEEKGDWNSPKAIWCCKEASRRERDGWLQKVQHWGASCWKGKYTDSSFNFKSNCYEFEILFTVTDFNVKPFIITNFYMNYLTIKNIYSINLIKSLIKFI